MEFEEHDEEMRMASPVEEEEQQQQQQQPRTMVRNNSFKGRYKECLKNHAITVGGHAVDGCGEFLAGGPEGSIDALKCAACNCHRNFHRQETSTTIITTTTAAAGDPFPPFSNRRHQAHQYTTCYRTPSGYLHVTGPPRGGSATLALPPPLSTGTAAGVIQVMEDHDDVTVIMDANPINGGVGPSSKKRFRTKFTQEQKEKMLNFAEKLGWRIQKQDEGMVQEFCNETGVKRQVLKVWMHNNKHTLGKKP